jgi:hypothetical protein
MQRLLSPATAAIPSGPVCSPLLLYAAALHLDALLQRLLLPVTPAVQGPCAKARATGMERVASMALEQDRGDERDASDIFIEI